MGHSVKEEESVTRKVLTTALYSGGAGVVLGMYDVIMNTKPLTRGVGPTIARIGMIAGPIMGIGLTYSSTLHITSNITKTDGYLNYFLSGAAAGGVTGAWVKSAPAGVFFAVAFGLAAIVKKQSIDQGWEFFPDFKDRESTAYTTFNHDFTLFRERPLNWRRE